MRDETIVFLELTFHNTSDLLLASRIEQSGHNEKVTEEIRAWAAAHGANVDATVNETAEETTYKITRLERESELSSTGVVSRVLDYWLEQLWARAKRKRRSARNKHDCCCSKPWTREELS